ncbi:Rrf2 family transcriptional regulator [Lactococcus termiticola]|uniref:Rrf2 family transcriptional regulator n=1 Tax=Lactococcus termiticola TaxID=2169526 RepID=A0A2R5HFG3_9LACT|nr:Rrf2 family transcriptional regulator [Lactococcus termiticola]GBG96045.1 Rrf2 family transcriptional regulator [Lactococcus termiticola]
MKLSSGWEQAVYVLLILGRLPEQSVIKSNSLAERLSVSPSYLSKIMKSLVNEGLVKSSLGKKGGFTLAKPLSDISFYDVFLAIEGRGKIFASQQLLINFLGTEGNKAKKCSVTEALDNIESTLVTTLSAVHLDKVAQQTSENYSLKDLDHWIQEHLS